MGMLLDTIVTSPRAQPRLAQHTPYWLRQAESQVARLKDVRTTPELTRKLDNVERIGLRPAVPVRLGGSSTAGPCPMPSV